MSEKISIHEYSRIALSKMRNKVFIVSALIVTPIYILLVIVFQLNTFSQALMPLTQQMAQSISVGDEIGLHRNANSLLLIPQALSVKIYLLDGSCAAAAEVKTAEKWNTDISSPCNSSHEVGLTTSRVIETPGIGPVGRVEVISSIPWKHLTLAPLILIICLSIANFIFKASIRKLIWNLVRMIESLPLIFQNSDDTKFELIEIDQVYNELQRLRKRDAELVSSASFKETAHQVSHDIRSPLAALEMLSGGVKELHEENRIILRNSVNRIRDIANSLIATRKNEYLLIDKFSEKQISPDSDPDTNLLAPLIEQIVSEKRVQYRDRLNIEIDFQQESTSYGAFVRCQADELKRVISNLVNNSVESISPNLKGMVKIELNIRQNGNVELLIADNGVGINPSILPTLGVKGRTFGKPEGTGLGLYHAIQTVSSWNGSLKLDSSEGSGTVVTIALPLQPTANWFVPEIRIVEAIKVIILDDDQSVHQIWKSRFESIVAPHNVQLFHFTGSEDLKKYYRENFCDLDRAIFLMDYEIIGDHVSGLDLIEELGISSDSILVTSRYDEPNVRERCEKLSLRIIPKSMSGFVPIQFC